jgi:hypothetical protein
MKIVLPPGYTGRLEIGCTVALTKDTTVRLDQGAGEVPCPKSADQVKVMQNDSELSPQPAITIEKGSDGAPVGLEFNVK